MFVIFDAIASEFGSFAAVDVSTCVPESFLSPYPIAIEVHLRNLGLVIESFYCFREERLLLSRF